MYQIPDSIQPNLNEAILMPLNQNMNILNPSGIPQLLPNQQNLPLNQNLPIGLHQPVGNNPQNEDTSKILFLN